MSLNDHQLLALETTERIASCLSVVGTSFIFITFVSSSKFRRPINRLVFYASWGNTISNVATLMSRSPIGYGSGSHLCQFQAFLIQMFVPADAFWNLAMAFNVYLTLFRKHNSSYLKSLEWRYLALCYGIPFTIAFVLLFPTPTSRSKIYGDAVLWCWIAEDWDFLRVALCYGPAWCCILASMTIYVWAGREIFVKRQQLRAFRQHGIRGGGHRSGVGVDGHYSNAGKGPPGSSDHSSDDSNTIVSDTEPSSPPYPINYKTTNVEITSTIVPLENIANVLLPGTDVMGNHNPRGAVGAGIRNASTLSGKVYEQYSVDIGAQPMGSPRLLESMRSGSAFSTAGGGGWGGGTEEQQARARKNRAAMEANRAAWGYTKVALLFFVSLLVTWVPSSVNRVYALTHPSSTAANAPLAFAAGIVLSLMGFWNSVIYIVTSRAACKELFYSIVAVVNLRRRERMGMQDGDDGGAEGVGKAALGQRAGLGSMMKPKARMGQSWGDEWERLGGGGGVGGSEVGGGDGGGGDDTGGGGRVVDLEGGRGRRRDDM